eukprot:1787078-Rhodomonas_salina.1
MKRMKKQAEIVEKSVRIEGVRSKGERRKGAIDCDLVQKLHHFILREIGRVGRMLACAHKPTDLFL